MERTVEQAIGAVWRIESAKIVAGVARLVRDIGLAEELAGDALVAALEHWPASGIPDNPGAWLMRTAKNAAFDHLRREKSCWKWSTWSSTKAIPLPRATTGCGRRCRTKRCASDACWPNWRRANRKRKAWPP